MPKNKRDTQSSKLAVNSLFFMSVIPSNKFQVSTEIKQSNDIFIKSKLYYKKTY